MVGLDRKDDPFWKCKEITLWPEIWWRDAMYHWSGSLFEMATLSQCSHFLIAADRGCCRSLNVLLFNATSVIATFWKYCLVPMIHQSPDRFAPFQDTRHTFVFFLFLSGVIPCLGVMISIALGYGSVGREAMACDALAGDNDRWCLSM